MFTWRISENTVCINFNNFCFNHLLLTKHFGDILFCILAVVLCFLVTIDCFSRALLGPQLFPVLLAAAAAPAKACQTNSRPPGSAFCLPLSKWKVPARRNKLALLFNLAELILINRKTSNLCQIKILSSLTFNLCSHKKILLKRAINKNRNIFKSHKFGNPVLCTIALNNYIKKMHGNDQIILFQPLDYR